MHVRPETFYTIFLTGRDVGRLRRDILRISEAEDGFNWDDYPTLDTLTDAICKIEDDGIEVVTDLEDKGGEG